MWTLLYGAGGSLVVALLYGWFIAQREERIRESLRARRRGYLRRRFVRALVGAIRGRAALLDTVIIATVPLLFLLISAGTLLQSAAGAQVKLDGLWESHSEMTQRIQEKKDKGPKAEPKDPHKGLEVECQELADELATLEGSGRALILTTWVISSILLVSAVLGYILWLPFVLMRRWFSCELDRFTLRMQGLSSKAELAELALLESLVVDEESLRGFVEKARQVAERHQVGALVRTFDLWEGEGELGEENPKDDK